MFSFDVIPVIGQLVANDRASYQYLVERCAPVDWMMYICSFIFQKIAFAASPPSLYSQK